MYRDAIEVPDMGSVLANVKVIAAGELWSYTGGQVDDSRQRIMVTFPRWTDVDLKQIREFTWNSDRYDVTSLVVPITALGRVDHYELTATRDFQ